MKIEALNDLVEVVLAGSINKAAKQSSIPQQSLSKMMKSLELEFGVRLFERTNQGVVLTEAGEDVYQFARWCLDEYKALQQTISPPLETVAKQEIKIMAMDTAIQNIVPAVLATVYRKNLPFDLQVERGAQLEIIEAVLQQQIQFGLVLQYQQEDEAYPVFQPELQFIRLYGSQPYCWVNSKNPLAEKRSISFQDLRLNRIINMKSSDRGLMAFIFRKYGIEEQEVLWLDNVYYVAKMVEKDIGIALDLKTKDFLNLSSVLQEKAMALPLGLRQRYEVVTGLLIRKDILERIEIKELVEIFMQSK